MENSSLRQKILSTYPAPLALAYKRMDDLSVDENPFIKHSALVNLVEVIIKYCACIVIRQYCEDKKIDKYINKQLQNLSRPSLGHWVSFLKEILNFYHRNNYDIILPELYDFYNKKNESLKASIECHEYLSKLIRVKKYCGIFSVKDMFDLLLTYRNISFGHGATIKPIESMERIKYLRAALDEILGEMEFISKLKLAYVKEIIYKNNLYEYSLIFLNGVDNKCITYKCDVKNKLDNELLYLFSDVKGNLQPLFTLNPLMIYSNCEVCRKKRFYFLNEGRIKDLEYLSYECGHIVTFEQYLKEFEEIVKGEKNEDLQKSFSSMHKKEKPEKEIKTSYKNLDIDKRPLPTLKVMLNRLANEGHKTWPSPVANGMELLLREQSSDKVLAILGFLDSLAPFLSSPLISIYINDPDKKFDNQGFNREIFDNFLSKNKAPTLGQWIGILRTGLTHFKNDPHFFMPELLEFTFNGLIDPLNKNNRIYLITREKTTGLLDDLNEFRCSAAHPNELSNYLKKYNIKYDPKDNILKGYELAFPAVITNLIRLLYGLKFLSNYWLFYIKNLREDEEPQIAEIQLYCSSNPYLEELEIKYNLFQKTGYEKFKLNTFRYKLLLAKVEKIDDPLFPKTHIKRFIEINPVVINWLRDSEYSPHQFVKWKEKNNKEIFMTDIIYQKGEEEVVHEDTRERLWETYEKLEEKLDLVKGKGKGKESATNLPFTLSHSSHYYEIVRKEIYPHLNIAEEILAGVKFEKKKKEEIIDLQVSLASTSEKFSLKQAIEAIQKNPDKWNCLLMGEGGMGKTTSLLKLWESFLKEKKHFSIPVFLRLEAYNRMKPERRRDFIWYIINQEYKDLIPDEKKIKELENQFIQSYKVNGKEFPSVILLLDGFNEVTADKEELLACIKDLIRLKGVQVIISSRYDIRKGINPEKFEILNLEPLDDEQIETFMTLQRKEFSKDLLKNIPLLRNPMMLTLYCGLEREMIESEGKEDYEFIPLPRNKSEILHNFIASSLARQDRISSEDKAIHRLYLRHLLPRIGYEMKKSEVFDINHRELMKIIKEEMDIYSSIEFLDKYPELEMDMTDKVKCSIDSLDRKNIIEAIRRLKERYCLLRAMEDNTYAFLHQDFQDYFAEVYINLEQLDRFKKREEKIKAEEETRRKPQEEENLNKLEEEKKRKEGEEKKRWDEERLKKLAEERLRKEEKEERKVQEEKRKNQQLKKREEEERKEEKRIKAEEETKKRKQISLHEMVLIPGGIFQMGSNSAGLFEFINSKLLIADETPSHSVSLDSFYIGKYEVTNKYYCEFLNSQGNQRENRAIWIGIKDDKYCGITGGVNPGTFKVKENYENHPVVYISWYGAVAYCNWLSDQEGLQKCYGEKDRRGQVDITKNGYRLPTEAEWEYACHAGTTTVHYWGDKMDNAYCWYSDNSGSNHHPVGQKKPNNFGLYDMSGNVWEWCSDWYGKYPSHSVNNPTGPISGSSRVDRGGSYCDFSSGCRSVGRRVNSPICRDNRLGFRLCRSAP